MSSGLECLFIEPIEGRWYYILQDGNCPVQCWDWMEYATCYGGFSSLEKAIKHLQDNHQNPGGWCKTSFANFKMTPVYEKLIGQSITPEVHNAYRPFRYRY